MFSTLYGTHFSFLIHFKTPFAICFNLGQSKILGMGKIIDVDLVEKCKFLSLKIRNGQTPRPRYEDVQ